MTVMKHFPRPCRICGQIFKPCKATQQMCSKKCMGVSERGPKHYRYNTGKFGGGRAATALGYIKTPKGYEHRAIAEKALGHPLPLGVQVHHVDGNKENNHPTNLVICQDEAYHKSLHANQRIVDAGGVVGKHLFCGFCKKLLPMDCFTAHKQNAARYGKSGWCRMCQSYKSKTARKARKQVIL